MSRRFAEFTELEADEACPRPQGCANGSVGGVCLWERRGGAGLLRFFPLLRQLLRDPRRPAAISPLCVSRRDYLLLYWRNLQRSRGRWREASELERALEEGEDDADAAALAVRHGHLLPQVLVVELQVGEGEAYVAFLGEGHEPEQRALRLLHLKAKHFTLRAAAALRFSAVGVSAVLSSFLAGFFADALSLAAGGICAELFGKTSLGAAAAAAFSLPGVGLAAGLLGLGGAPMVRVLAYLLVPHVLSWMAGAFVPLLEATSQRRRGVLAAVLRGCAKALEATEKDHSLRAPFSASARALFARDAAAAWSAFGLRDDWRAADTLEYGAAALRAVSGLASASDGPSLLSSLWAVVVNVGGSLLGWTVFVSSSASVLAAWGGELSKAREAGLAGLRPEQVFKALPEENASEKRRRLFAALNESLLARLRYAVQTADPQDLDGAVEGAYEAELSKLEWARAQALEDGSFLVRQPHRLAPSLSDVEEAQVARSGRSLEKRWSLLSPAVTGGSLPERARSSTAPGPRPLHRSPLRRSPSRNGTKPSGNGLTGPRSRAFRWGRS